MEFPPGFIRIALVLIVTLLALVVIRNVTRPSRESARTAQLELGGRARRMLLETDDALRRAERELGYARAAFGPLEAAPLAGALEAARVLVDGAFALGRQIDDDVPESTEARAAMLDRIVSDCVSARADVDAQVGRIAELRAMAADPHAVIAEAAAAIDVQRSACDRAEETVDVLRATYAESSVRPVAAMPASARDVLQRAAGELAAARSATSPEEGAIRVRAATVAIARSRELTEAVERHARTLDASERQVHLFRESAVTAIDAAQARLDSLASATPGTDPAEHELIVAGDRLTAARSSMAAADAAMVAVPRDALAVTEALTAAITLAGAAARALAAADASRAAADRSYGSAAALAAQAIAQGEAWLDDGRAPTTEERRIRATLAAARSMLVDAERLAPDDPVRASALAWTAHHDAVRASAALDPDRVAPAGHAAHSPEREELEKVGAIVVEGAAEAIATIAISAVVGAVLGGGGGASGGLGGGHTSRRGLGHGRTSGGGGLGGSRSSGGF